ncbi:unnamed protein product [Periconia digitata]|uniref:Uncharacterized protein n=1 Tax=Periconia digitata TaxID=1303443 RepID=A0A9W4UCE9_9PLEO|nr:unnamed protein product [Periconia digitata]
MKKGMQLQGVVGIPDAVYRGEQWSCTDSDSAVQEAVIHKVPKIQQPKIALSTLLAEASGTDTTPTTTTPTPTARPQTPKPQTELYDPTNPHLAIPPTSLSTLLSRIESSQRIRHERDQTRRYIHNPFLLEHLLSNAPSVHHLCRRCRPRRKCTLHRHGETFRQQTSISLCRHARMVLTWAIDDPCNDKGTWDLQIRHYFDLANDDYHYDPRAETREREVHASKCSVLNPEFRVALLAERVVEDFKRERKALRGSERRVAKEIHGLLGAALRAQREKEEVEKAGERLAETLRGIAAATRVKDGFEDAVVRSIEAPGAIPLPLPLPSPPASSEDREKGEIEEVDKTEDRVTEKQPNHTPTSSPSPSQSTPSLPSAAQPTVSTTFTTNSTATTATIGTTPPYNPPSSPLYKRKRSRTASIASPTTKEQEQEQEREVSTPPRKKAKKSVTWAPEIDTSVGVTRVRMLSPQLGDEEEVFSPVVCDDDEKEKEESGSEADLEALFEETVEEEQEADIQNVEEQESGEVEGENDNTGGEQEKEVEDEVDYGDD